MSIWVSHLSTASMACLPQDYLVLKLTTFDDFLDGIHNTLNGSSNFKTCESCQRKIFVSLLNRVSSTTYIEQSTQVHRLTNYPIFHLLTKYHLLIDIVRIESNSPSYTTAQSITK